MYVCILALIGFGSFDQHDLQSLNEYIYFVCTYVCIYTYKIYVVI